MNVFRSTARRTAAPPACYRWCFVPLASCSLVPRTRYSPRMLLFPQPRPDDEREPAPGLLRSLLSIACALLFAGCPPVNDCDFLMRCDGGVLEQCGDGIDQQIGRQVRSIACGPLNPICVEEGQAAGCFASADPCDAGSSRCEGPVAYACSTSADGELQLVSMPRAYLLAEDCSSPIREADGGQTPRACRLRQTVAQCD